MIAMEFPGEDWAVYQPPDWE